MRRLSIFLTGALTFLALNTATAAVVKEKIYVPIDKIVFDNGRLCVWDGDQIIQIKKLRQDEDGLFIYKSYTLYGTCPNGHARDRDGYCHGGPNNDCIYSY